MREITAIDAGLEAEPTRAIDLSSLVRDLVAARHESAGRTSVDLDIAGGPFTVHASAERLAQVLTNLLDNAESFTPEGERITVGLSRHGDHARLTVSDHGPGIPPAHAERVFERFFTHRPGQPDARETHAGLGLSIARTIVESYGGTIRAVPAERGARFDVLLPLRETPRG